MQIEVVYRSLTGHSKKLAKAVAAELSVEAQNLKSKPVLKGIDILFFAGAIYGGKSMKDTLDFFKDLDSSAVRRVALITSSASDKKGQEKIVEILAENKIEFVGEYRCKGNFLFIKMGHPSKKEIADAVEFAKEIAANLE